MPSLVRCSADANGLSCVHLPVNNTCILSNLICNVWLSSPSLDVRKTRITLAQARELSHTSASKSANACSCRPWWQPHRAHQTQPSVSGFTCSHSQQHRSGRRPLSSKQIAVGGCQLQQGLPDQATADFDLAVQATRQDQGGVKWGGTKGMHRPSMLTHHGLDWTAE